MVDLLKNKENKKENLIWNLVGNSIIMVLLFMLLLITVFMSTGPREIVWFLDIPSVIVVMGFLFITLGIGGQLKYFFMGIMIPFRRKDYYNNNVLKKIEYTVGASIVITVISGILGSIIGIVLTMAMIEKPEQLGPNLAGSILTIFYAMVFILIMYGIKIRIHSIIEQNKE